MTKVIRITKVRGEPRQGHPAPRHQFVCSECPDWRTHDPSMVEYHVAQHGVGKGRASKAKTAFRFVESVEIEIRDAVYKG